MTVPPSNSLLKVAPESKALFFFYFRAAFRSCRVRLGVQRIVTHAILQATSVTRLDSTDVLNIEAHDRDRTTGGSGR